MQVFDNFLKIINSCFSAQTAYAHCDIPCGVYTSQPAETAAATVVRMVEKILDLPGVKSGGSSGISPEQLLKSRNDFVRMVMVKEDHAQICKKELLILWTDYFKGDHLKMFPTLHETFWKAAKLCSENKQNIDLEKAKKLQAAVHEIAHMFEEAEKAKK